MNVRRAVEWASSWANWVGCFTSDAGSAVSTFTMTCPRKKGSIWMKFDKKLPKINKRHGQEYESNTSTFGMGIDQGKSRIYIGFYRRLTDHQQVKMGRIPYDNDKIYFTPRIRVSKKDTVLYAQVLKELLLEIEKLPDIPTDDQFREAIRKVAYKYGEPTDKAKTNFLASVKMLNAKKHKAESKERIGAIIQKGLRARTLAGKDRQLRKLSGALDS